MTPSTVERSILIALIRKKPKIARDPFGYLVVAEDNLPCVYTEITLAVKYCFAQEVWHNLVVDYLKPLNDCLTELGRRDLRIRGEVRANSETGPHVNLYWDTV